MVLLHWVWMRTRVAERVQDADDVAEVAAVVLGTHVPSFPLVGAAGVLRAAENMVKAVLVGVVDLRQRVHVPEGAQRIVRDGVAVVHDGPEAGVRRPRGGAVHGAGEGGVALARRREGVQGKDREGGEGAVQDLVPQPFLEFSTL